VLNSDRKIIEALRTGVPIREVVDLLGCGQPNLEKEYVQLLHSKRRGAETERNGFVFFGGFGTGKSHVLEAFSKIAIDANFVVSRATISNNLKLGTPADIIKSLVSNTQTKEHIEDGFERLLADALSDRKDLTSLAEWLQDEVNDGRISSIYLGIANRLPREHYGTEIFELTIDFLRGGSVGGKLKQLLFDRTLTLPPAKTRPAETSAFLTRLFISLGYSGWVVLLDELELIRLLAGHITRGRSYAELANWMGYDEQRPTQGLTVIGCMTAGYVRERIDWSNSGPSEELTIPPRMDVSSAAMLLADAAKHGMELLQFWDEDEDLQLNPPTIVDLNRIQAILIDTYESAYGMKVTPVPTKNLNIDPMRVHIRRWIVSWDLERQGRHADLQENRVTQTFFVEDENDDDNSDYIY